MKFRRFLDLIYDVVSIPVVVVACTGFGFYMGLVACWNRLLLSWKMRGSFYSWEENHGS